VTVFAAKPDLSFCGAAQLNIDHAEADAAFKEASYLHLGADRLAMLAWIIPLGFALAFYAGRWALAGRIRPFWPLKKV
jgi:hypothetical protein